VSLLQQHRIRVLVDVRRYPSSRRLPHFNRPNLEQALAEHGIRYIWLESLGGQRQRGLEHSPNIGLRDPGFRNYADYMLSDGFQTAAARLMETARKQRSAIMCAESSFRQCHRKLISDFLLANGVQVRHILSTGDLQQHTLTSGARLQEDRVTYPERHPLFDQLES
jgi:uncharacterized protein (DUF488 family)